MTKAELSILLTGDSEIRALNRAWRQHDSPTDVLSFAQLDEAPPNGYDGPLGDVVVSLDTAAEQAQDGFHQQRLEWGSWGYDEEVLFLVIHGVLHLIGRHHDDDDAETAMRAEERRLFEQLRPGLE